MIDVFISYARRDRDRALALTRALKERGFSVQWDWDFFGSEDLKGAIDQAIGKASKVLVLWSAQSIAFDVVVGEALEAKKQGNLVSISIDGSAPPAEFADLATIFLPDTTTGLDEVVAAIKSRAPRNIPPGHAVLRKFGHVLTGSAMALGLTMAAVTFWLNLPPPRPLGEERLGIAAASLMRQARYLTNSASPSGVVTGETFEVQPAPPSPADAAATETADAKVPAKVKVVLGMVVGTCVVSDTSGSRPDVLASPQGAVVSTLANGRFVQIADVTADAKGQPWVLVASNESGKKLGWVSRKFISCP